MHLDSRFSNVFHRENCVVLAGNIALRQKRLLSFDHFFNELMAIIFIYSIAPHEGKEISINWEGQSTDFPRDLWITIQFRDKKRAVLYWISVHPLFHCHRPPVDSHAVAIQTHTRQSQTGNQTDLIWNQTNLSLKQHKKYGIEAGKIWN